MGSDTLLTDLAHTIELAVAPVFLLTALGTLLSVLSQRLARIVDRARSLCSRAESEIHGATREEHHAELVSLGRRRSLINYGITCATLAALQVCLLIASAFVGFMIDRNFSLLIASLFIGAMAAFVGALLFFLREVLIAVASPGIRTLPRL